MSIDNLHDSVLDAIISNLDIRSRCRIQSLNREWGRSLGYAAYWSALQFDLNDGQKEITADGVLRLMRRAQGQLHTLTFARLLDCTEDNQLVKFSNGLQRVPLAGYTQEKADTLAELCGSLRCLVLPDCGSPIGGMTDSFAKALAKQSPCLERLEIVFTQYGLESEQFTDEGLLALAEASPNLKVLHLEGCDHISDRSFFGLAAYCRQLQEITIDGYSERITDTGASHLFRSCTDLRSVLLDGRLVKLTDHSVTALATACTCLEVVQLPAHVSDQGLLALADSASALTLQRIDLHCCGDITVWGVCALANACRSATIATPLTDCQ